MLGLHPCHVGADWTEVLDRYEALWTATPEAFVAVGELGLDLYWDKTTLDWQVAALERQLEWCLRWDKPFSMHVREAWGPTMDVLRAWKGRGLRGVLHCFTGSREIAAELIDMGLHLGIGGVATFPKAGVVDVLRETGLDRVVLETDSPYLAPVPFRGKRNESAYLRDRTGNRRFWPIPVTKPVRVAWLRKWRDQLFAEAYALHLQGVPYTPSREEEARLFEPEQDARLVETGVTSELLHALTRDPGKGPHAEVVNNLADFVTLSDLLKCLLVDAGKSNAGLESQIRTWMNQQGWEYKKKQIGGVRQAGWHRPKDWPFEEPAEDLPLAPAQAGDGPDPVDEDFLGDDPF
jgi:hypothetical protein